MPHYDGKKELTPASSETASSPDSTSDQTCFTTSQRVPRSCVCQRSDSVDSVVPRLDPCRPRQKSWPYEQEAADTGSAPARQSWHCRTSIVEDMQPDELWKLEFMNRSRDHTVVDVGLSDSDQAASDASASAGGQPNDWEVQMLVAEMDRSERQQRRSLVPDLTFSELELLGRLEGGRPARSTVGRMASMDAVHVAGQAERCRLGRNASLRESSSSRRRPLRKRELVTTMSDTAGASFNNSRAQHRPLLQGVNGDSSRDSSPATKGRASGSNPSQVVESVAL
ncbi:uncharacterized protein LOC119111511 [Pollicipes pollicipes]|uniref:uncharacterized protein LOC119111511 n=1 Tax=Pollicipes pollicipes TaxID=41117 RepID=UPI001884C597|nr:uncharacterized protein LOC119111511 [Pollicipes pollicipes]